jgi:hypothetical protein
MRLGYRLESTRRIVLTIEFRCLEDLDLSDENILERVKVLACLHDVGSNDTGLPVMTRLVFQVVCRVDTIAYKFFTTSFRSCWLVSLIMISNILFLIALICDACAYEVAFT